MEILGIIPARGGSKVIPRKNIRLLFGKPLILWTIEECKKSKCLTRFIISTDDEEIAQIAKGAGAEVPFLRPKEISQDFSADVEFFLHALNFLKEKENYEPDIVLRLPPTSPLRTAKHIDDGIETLLKLPEADSVRPIIPAPKHPYKMWKIKDGTSYIEPFLPESFTGMSDAQMAPRQSLPKAYIHTGAMDVVRTKTIREKNSTAGKTVGYFFMQPEDSVNI